MTRRRRVTPPAVIEEDACNAFSRYRSATCLRSPSENIVAEKIGDQINRLGNYPTKIEGRQERRDKRDGKPKGSRSRRKEKMEVDDSERAPVDADRNANKRHPNILHTDDPTLQAYLPQLTFLNNNYYSKVKPFRMGKRNLPLNQIEVVLRRNAVKKGADVRRGKPSVEGAGKWSVTRIQRYFESKPPLPNTIIDNSHITAVAIFNIPKEEIMGDTSLGLKLTILQGKVIIQHISGLDDGRASPAQVCGLLSPGDIMIAVNGKSLINGTIHNPVTMDKIISVLKPLSQPINEQTKEYSREVRLRFALGDGKSLLRVQDERERRKLEDRELRKMLGLAGGNAMASDPAAVLFGIGALMAVDQHSGMPMFGNFLEHSNEEYAKEEKKETDDDKGDHGSMKFAKEVVGSTKATRRKREIHPVLFLARARPTLQAQIAYQVQLDLLCIRNQNASEFFTLNETASSLLRPPSPLPVKTIDLYEENLIYARQQRLEHGTQTMTNAKSLFSLAELQDRVVELFQDGDSIEVAPNTCVTSSVYTGASRRRWHGEDCSVIAEDALSEAPLTSTADNPNIQQGSIRPGESGVAECDHRLLVELAATNEFWKTNVLKRLAASVAEIEKEKSGHNLGSSFESCTANEKAPISSFDRFLFGDVASFLGRKKQSFALPPAEMTSMLFDLVEMLESGLPDHSLMKESPLSTFHPLSSEKVVTPGKIDFARSDTKNATDFLLNLALGEWLKSFRPLQWKHRHALWSFHQSGLDGDSMVSYRTDDDDSLSLMSGFTSQTRMEKDTRNLKELIEDLTLSHETRGKTCHLVTFFFTRRFLNLSISLSNRQTSQSSRLTQEAEDEAVALIDAYGSYLDLYKCLVFAGKLHSKVIIDKLMCLANYDSQHKLAVKALQKEKKLLLYEPSLLSAMLQLLPCMSTKQSSGIDFMTLLVSAFPDLQPWFVHEASQSEYSGDFYGKYLGSLLHYDYGNDAAKRDEALVKEWCLMLCSLDEGHPSITDVHRRSFLHIATCNDQISYHYCRDLPFLMDCSMKISEFGLTLSLAHEITNNPRYCHNKQVLRDVVQHLHIISVKAVESNRGEVNKTLLGQLIAFYIEILRCMEENNCSFDIVAELCKLVEKCSTEHQNNLHYSLSNAGACITIISETAPPTYSLQVLSNWDHTTSVGYSTFVSAIHSSLIRGAREGVCSGLSGSLLRIQRTREEGRQPIVENDTMSWKTDTEQSVDCEEESGGVIWSSLLDGSAVCAK